jgi:hypothetical protein
MIGRSTRYAPHIAIIHIIAKGTAISATSSHSQVEMLIAAIVRRGYCFVQIVPSGAMYFVPGGSWSRSAFDRGLGRFISASFLSSGCKSFKETG